MCDRSYSDASLGTDLKVAPHIRDALLKAQEAAGAQDSDAFMEPPSFPQAAAANGEALEAALSHANSVASNALRKAATSSRRESQLVTRVNERDHQVRELKGYVHDVLRSQTKEHAYLRATHLDPAVGLEIELGRNEPTSTPPPNDELAEARAALAASDLQCDQLRLEVRELQAKLRKERAWSEQLEREREEMQDVRD